jgi:hypothetical protein
MKSSGDERYHIENVLGISTDKYEEGNPLSGLFTIAFCFNCTDLLARYFRVACPIL